MIRLRMSARSLALGSDSIPDPNGSLNPLGLGELREERWGSFPHSCTAKEGRVRFPHSCKLTFHKLYNRKEMVRGEIYILCESVAYFISMAYN